MSLGTIEPHPGDEMRQRALRSGRAVVEIAVDLHGVDGPLPGVTQNISPDGVFVATPEVIAVGERLMLMLAFPGDRGPLAVRAEVRWARPPRPAPMRGGRPAWACASSIRRSAWCWQSPTWSSRRGCAARRSTSRSRAKRGCAAIF